jgi:hypothetical protein
MLCWQDGRDRVGPHGVRPNAVPLDWSEGKSCIQRSGMQRFHLLLTAHLHDLEFDLVGVRSIPGEQVGKAWVRYALCETNGQSAFSAFRSASCARTRLGERCQYLSRLLEEYLSSPRKTRTARGAVKQLYAKIGFELLDGPGEWRLFYVQALCGPQKVQLLGDCDEVAKTA